MDRHNEYWKCLQLPLGRIMQYYISDYYYFFIYLFCYLSGVQVVANIFCTEHFHFNLLFLICCLCKWFSVSQQVRLWHIFYSKCRVQMWYVITGKRISQGRIIHEAGEAEASGPGARAARYYEKKVGPLWARKFLERKYANICTRGPQSLPCLRARRDHDPALELVVILFFFQALWPVSFQKWTPCCCFPLACCVG